MPDAPNPSYAYGLLHQQQVREEEANRHAARQTLPILLRYCTPGSVLDVGCGVGTWLGVARELGFREVLGVEGPWLDPALLRIDRRHVLVCDLDRPLRLGRRFDLAMSLEVAEHLSPQAARGFVASLVAHGDLVLFSAAVPLQGGTHHVNEQWPDYWAALFAEHDFLAVDIVRPAIWEDRRIPWWYRQNALVFAAAARVAATPDFACARAAARPLAVVHPENFLFRAQALQRAQGLLDHLSAGGTFSVQRRHDGSLEVVRLSP